MEPQSYEVQVLKDRKWEIARVFTSDDKAMADSLYLSLTGAMGYGGKKLIAEVMRDDGVVIARTLSVQIFDPLADGPAPAAKQPPTPPPPRAAAGTVKRPASGGGGGGGILQSLFGFLSLFGRSARPNELAQFAAAKNAPVAKFGDPKQTLKKNRAINPNSTAYETKYPDELADGKSDVIDQEIQELLGRDFFEYIRTNLLNEDLVANANYGTGVFCFTIGALVKIENSIDFSKDRGRMILGNTLSMLMFSSEDVEDFMTRMLGLLTQDGSRRFIKAGARCLGYYHDAQYDKLLTTFRKSFGVAEVDEGDLGVIEDIGIIFTDIVDSTELNSEIGDFKSQKVVDHHEAVIQRNCAKHGGRILKHLGDGFMLAFHDGREMVAFIRSALSDYGGEGIPEDVEAYRIRLGGHFGQAIEKNGDYFGSTVALAARISSKAGDMQGALLMEYREMAKAANLTIAEEATVSLKGFKEPFSILLLT